MSCGEAGVPNGEVSHEEPLDRPERLGARRGWNKASYEVTYTNPPIG
jgi:hypothetical protein